MTNDEILAAFVRPESFPEDAVALAGERREEIAPLLIAEIEACARGERQNIQGSYYLSDIALHLLAEWREPRGFKPMLALLASPYSEILGDTITEYGAELLAQLYDGDLAALRELILNRSANEFIRETILGAHTVLVKDGTVPRDDYHAFLLQLYETTPRVEDYIWCGWAAAVSSLLFADLIPRVKQLFDEESISPTIMDYEDFESDFEDSRRGVAKPWTSDRYRAIEKMRHWHYVKPGEERDMIDDESEEEFFSSLDTRPAHNPYRDVGRNDPCPCGSGKKFKKCCLLKAEADRR